MARNDVNTCSFVRGNDVWVVGLANLDEGEIRWIQDEIDRHTDSLGVHYNFHYRYHQNELSLLNDIFFNFIAKSECVTGWNWFGYDWPYLVKKASNLGIDIQKLSPTGTWMKYKPKMAKTNDDTITVPMHKAMYDYMEIYKNWDTVVSPKITNKLDWVAETVLGVKKVAHTLGFKDMWAQQKKEYVFYNAIDSILVREIDKKIKTSSIFFGLATLMHTPALTALSSTKSIEIVQAEYLYKENKVFPKSKKEGDGREYEGAFVYEPIPGVYNDVLTVDFASLYPTTMRQFNMSPDTFMFKKKDYRITPDEIKCVNGSVYTKRFKGFIPKILDDFYAKRKNFKKKMMVAKTEMEELEEILERRKGKL